MAIMPMDVGLIGTATLRRAAAQGHTPAFELAQRAHVDPPLGAPAQVLFTRACSEGLQALDDASLLTLMRRLFDAR